MDKFVNAFEDDAVEGWSDPRSVRGHGALRRGQRGRERRALPLLRPLPGYPIIP